MKVVFGNSGTLHLSVFVRPLTQIRCRSLVASLSLVPHLPNLLCTWLPTHLHPLSPNPFAVIENFQRQPGLKSLPKICNRCLPVQRSMSQLFQTVLSPDNGLLFPPKKPCHPYFLPLVKRTKAGLPHPLANCLKVNSICFKLIGALPSAPPESDKSSLS